MFSILTDHVRVANMEVDAVDQSNTMTNNLSIHLRTLRASDTRSTAMLHVHGRTLAGTMPAGPITPRQLEAEYFAHPPNHLWMAEVDGMVAGIVGIVHEQPMVARLQVLCVDPAWEEAQVAQRLLQVAVRHCHYFGYLKLVTTTTRPSDTLQTLASRCGLRFTRFREAEDTSERLMEFYVDLYRRTEAASCEINEMRVGEAIHAL